MKAYPYSVEFYGSNWTPDVHRWFNGIPRENWRRRAKALIDIGLDEDILTFEFIDKEDAIAFGLIFGIIQ